MIHAAIAHALYATRLFNVTITNVPSVPELDVFVWALNVSLRELLELAQAGDAEPVVQSRREALR